jgi:hypothetical protein
VLKLSKLGGGVAHAGGGGLMRVLTARSGTNLAGVSQNKTRNRLALFLRERRGIDVNLHAHLMRLLKIWIDYGTKPI